MREKSVYDIFGLFGLTSDYLNLLVYLFIFYQIYAIAKGAEMYFPT